MAGGVNPTCPACGFESGEIRCPRCNTLKIVGCTGACSSCRDGSCKTKVPPRPGAAPAHRPSDDARDDGDLIGTPLEP